MKKALALILCLVMLLGVFPMNAAFAEGETEKLTEAKNASVGEGEILYLTEKTTFATLQNMQKAEGVSAISVNSVRASRIEKAFYVIVDYQELISNKTLLKIVKETVARGKTVLIRANGQETNRDEVFKLFGKEPDFVIEDSEIDALKSQYQTFGYMVYLDGSYGLEVVCQEFESVSFQEKLGLSDDEWVSGKITDEAKLYMKDTLSSIAPYSFKDIVEAATLFVSKNRQELATEQQGDSTMAEVPSYTVWPHHQKYKTKYYSEESYNNKKIGFVTIIIYAKRIFPEATPSSTEITHWVFLSAVDMTSGYDRSDYLQTRNYKMKTRLFTKPGKKIYLAYPLNKTYKKYVEDFEPTTDASGSTDATYSLGGSYSNGHGSVNAGVSWKATYKDVQVVSRPYYSSSVDYAEWEYTINKSKTNGVAKNVRLLSSILEENKNTTAWYPFAAVYLSVTPTWYYGGTLKKDVSTYSMYLSQR